MKFWPNRLYVGIHTLLLVTLFSGVFSLPVNAQDDACMGDALRVLSPTSVEVQLSLEGRFGAVVAWPEMSDDISTCSSSANLVDVDFDIELSGAFADIVDRELNFYVEAPGIIGSQTDNRVVLAWNNANQEATGSIIGEINLSNSGGAYYYDAESSQWLQYNTNLPMNLPYTDLSAFSVAVGAQEKVFAQLSSSEFFFGLWMSATDENGSNWSRIAETQFPDGRLDDFEVLCSSFSPGNSNILVLGSSNDGIWLSADDGSSFTQIVDGFEDITNWSNRPVTNINWVDSSHLYIAVKNAGVYFSSDSGASFSSIGLNIDLIGNPGSAGTAAYTVNQIFIDEADVDHIYFAVKDYCLYETTDAGDSWSWPAQSLVLDGSNLIPVNGLTVVVDGSSVIVGSETSGIFRTSDSGETWTNDTEILFAEGTPEILNIIDDQNQSRLLAIADQYGLLECAYGDDQWVAPLVDLPGNTDCSKLTKSSNSILWVATERGGVFQPGSSLSLSSTIYKSQTEENYQDLELGINLLISEGTLFETTAFDLIFQDFQGYAVWRSQFGSMEDMQLIGLYDKNNPETCMLDYCGDENYPIEPECWAEKRSACYDFSVPGMVSFFDDGIFNSFIYYYAVSTFDSGNTATVSGPAITNDPLYSPRFPNDPLVPLDEFGDPVLVGDGNIVRFDANRDALSVDSEELVYAYPNPLRLEAGFPEAPGELVTFTNLPAGSRVMVFTVSGDIVADLTPDLQEGRNIKWFTRNDSDELLASGVYIYKVESPGREDYFSKIIIIR